MGRQRNLATLIFLQGILRHYNSSHEWVTGPPKSVNIYEPRNDIWESMYMHVKVYSGDCTCSNHYIY